MDNLAKIISVAVSRKHIIDKILVSAVVVQFYDWLLTLPAEVRYIWSSPWNWSKVLYLFTRYTPFITMTLEIRNRFSLNPTPESCKRTLQAVSWLAVAGLDFAEIILAVRTYAVWKRDKRVGIGLVLLLTIFQIPNTITLYKYIQGLGFIANPLPEIYRGCAFNKATRVVYANWVALTILEGVVLVLMIISAVHTYRERTSNLLHVVYRDGIRFYLYIFCVTLTNVLMTLLLPIDFVGIGSDIEIVLHSILACRLLIGIREASGSLGRKPETFELFEAPRYDAPGFAHTSPIESASMVPEPRAGPSRA